MLNSIEQPEQRVLRRTVTLPGSLCPAGLGAMHVFARCSSRWWTVSSCKGKVDDLIQPPGEEGEEEEARVLAPSSPSPS